MTYIYNIIYVKTAYITHIAGKGEGVRGARRGLMLCFRRVQDIAPLKHFPAHTHTIKLKCVCWGGGGEGAGSGMWGGARRPRWRWRLPGGGGTARVVEE